MRHVFQEAYKLLFVESTRAVGVDLEELLVLVWVKVAMSEGRVTPGVRACRYKWLWWWW